MGCLLCLIRYLQLNSDSSNGRMLKPSEARLQLLMRLSSRLNLFPSQVYLPFFFPSAIFHFVKHWLNFGFPGWECQGHHTPHIYLRALKPLQNSYGCSYLEAVAKTTTPWCCFNQSPSRSCWGVYILFYFFFGGVVIRLYWIAIAVILVVSKASPPPRWPRRASNTRISLANFCCSVSNSLPNS